MELGRAEPNFGAQPCLPRLPRSFASMANRGQGRQGELLGRALHPALGANMPPAHASWRRGTGGMVGVALYGEPVLAALYRPKLGGHRRKLAEHPTLAEVGLTSAEISGHMSIAQCWWIAASIWPEAAGIGRH